MQKENRVKRAIRSGNVALGLMVTEMRTPQLGAMLDVCEVDFIVLDMEHGFYSYETVADMIAGLHGTRVEPFVRVPALHRECFAKTLDAGALGVLVPEVETADDVLAAIRYTKYAPLGERGVSLRKPHTGFCPPGRVEYTRWANENTMVMVQVETARGLANVEEIMSVEGLDLAFIGPADLEHSLTPQSEAGAPELIDRAVDRVLTAGRGAGCAVGIHMANVASATSLLDRGVQLLTFGSDVSIFMDACRETARQIRLPPKQR